MEQTDEVELEDSLAFFSGGSSVAVFSGGTSVAVKLTWRTDSTRLGSGLLALSWGTDSTRLGRGLSALASSLPWALAPGD